MKFPRKIFNPRVINFLYFKLYLLEISSKINTVAKRVVVDKTQGTSFLRSNGEIDVDNDNHHLRIQYLQFMFLNQKAAQSVQKLDEDLFVYIFNTLFKL